MSAFYLKLRKIRFQAIIIFIFFTVFTVSFGQNKQGNIKIQVLGFENSNGKARILVFNEAQAKYYPSKHEKALIKEIVPIKNNKVEFEVQNLPYGNYAISVHHDENGDNKVNKNFLGIPTEGLGASNDAKGFFGPPSFEKAKIVLDKDVVSIVINMVN